MTVGVKIRHHKVKGATHAEMQRWLKAAITVVDQHRHLKITNSNQVGQTVTIDVCDPSLAENAVDAALLSKSAVAIAQEDIRRCNKVRLSVVVEISDGNGTDRRDYLVTGAFTKSAISVAQKNGNVAVLQEIGAGHQIQDAVSV